MKHLTDEATYLSKVLDENKYDKKFYYQKPDFKYYQFSGKTLPLTESLDIRKNMIFGLKLYTTYTLVHVPQYHNVFKIKLKVANSILQRSKLYLSKYYEEV